MSSFNQEYKDSTLKAKVKSRTFKAKATYFVYKAKAKVKNTVKEKCPRIPTRKSAKTDGRID